MIADPDEAEQPMAPGITLSDIPRRDDKERVRLSLVTYRGERFASLRVWSRSASGDYRPTTRGLHLRLGELATIREAIEVAIRVAAPPSA